MNRLDELIQKLNDSVGDMTGEYLDGDDYFDIIQILRAGRELASYVKGLDLDYLSNTVTLKQIDDKDTLLNDYDRAVAGTNAIAGGGDE